MKFHLVRPALVLASSLVLASCGGGSSSDTYPVKVTVSNVQYEGLILTTNGQEVAVHKPAKEGDAVVVTFPNGLDYGTYYNVIPKGGTAGGGGSQPAHQNCATNGYPREYGTAGQTASLESARKPAIEVFYSCVVNTFALGGTVTGLDSDTATLTIVNGSNSQVTIKGSSTAASIPFSLSEVAFNKSFGVDVLPTPGYVCSVSGNGTGIMLEAQEAAKGVTDIVISCKKS